MAFAGSPGPLVGGAANRSASLDGPILREGRFAREAA